MIIVLNDEITLDSLPKIITEDIYLLRMLKSKMIKSNKVLKQFKEMESTVDNLEYTIQICSDSGRYNDEREYQEVLETYYKQKEKLELIKKELEIEIEETILNLPSRLSAVIQTK